MANGTQEESAFLYIPDITGFTEFMTNTDPEESHKIVAEMLKWIANANILNFEISDIVGDAVFFFKTGEPPPLNEVIRQSKIIFDGFHAKLKTYGVTYDSENKKFASIHRLSIKFVAHYGEVAISNIENHISLIGTPVIEVNKLLKNSVRSENYLLTTEKYLQHVEKTSDLNNFYKGSDKYEYIGQINYRVLDL